MTEDDGKWFTDPEHHWQASDLVKCVVSTVNLESIITQQYYCARKYWNIYFPCELLKWATLWNGQSKQSSTLSRTVKQPIRAELNIIIHDPSK